MIPPGGEPVFEYFLHVWDTDGWALEALRWRYGIASPEMDGWTLKVPREVEMGRYWYHAPGIFGGTELSCGRLADVL